MLRLLERDALGFEVKEKCDEEFTAMSGLRGGDERS